VDADFWHQRWEANKIGFHLGAVNPYLVEYWPRLQLPVGSRVFVPLCGKSLDMLWLAEQGHDVLGVEISPLAVQAFFEENRLPSPKVAQQGAFEIWSVPQITLICGDYFELQASQLGEMAAVYDRASLIALPPDLRVDYVTQLQNLCHSAIPHLLITLEYDQENMAGPPFSVDAEEVLALYPPPCELERLAVADILSENQGFRDRGLGSLLETVWQIGA